MGYHSFSIDPRTVLGVGPNASPDEIREAYRAKSKKHHPDVGGDEWAFRMVARSYEVLKTTADAPPAPRRWESPVANAAPQAHSPGWTWVGNVPFGGFAATSPRASDFADPSGSPIDTHEEDPSDSSSSEAEAPVADPAELRTIDVELIWTRFEFERDVNGPLLSAQKEDDDATLSVCMVVSWPPQDLVEDAAKFPSSAETLRTVIDRFQQVRGQKSVVAARSRIEDGRFVGWLSYPDVLTAQDAFLNLRDSFGKRGMTVKLQTRDERVPFDWHRTFGQTVMSQAS